MMLYGALLGDIIGSPYEFNKGDKKKDFPLFVRCSRFTDDSVMTIAVAKALLEAEGCRKAAKDREPSDAERFGRSSDAVQERRNSAAAESIRKAVVKHMSLMGHQFPRIGYGGRFEAWIITPDREKKPYGSYGNGSAMRVSPVGWLYDDLETTIEVAGWTADVTHDHPEGIKGAQSVAAAIYLARTGATKEEIRALIEERFGYDLSRTCDEIRPAYHHIVSCQGSVPESIIAFLESSSTEDAMRLAVSLGGDTDTMACIAGSIAEAMYGVPEQLKAECLSRIPEDWAEVIREMEEF